jgi:short-subunit dehydrogenase
LIGNVILITGASGGIGRATALAFARRGVNVAATARRADKLDDLAREIAGLGGQCLPIEADVADRAAMESAVAQAVERYGRLDVLVANAGVGQRGALAESDWRDLETVLRTNIDGVLYSVRAALPPMRKAGGGHIVLVSSLAGVTATPYTAVYGASKAFVGSLARSLALELEPDRITVTNLIVGPVDTEFSRNRLGAAGHSSGAAKLPGLSAEQVADRIVRAAAERRSGTAYVRLFDRLIVLANLIAPGLIGRQAVKRYKT